MNKNITLFVIMIAMSTLAQDLRWPVQATETTWRENTFTGHTYDVKTRDKLSTLIVKMTHAKLNTEDGIVFSHAKMKNSDDSSEKTQAFIPWNDRQKLVDALKSVIDAMRRPSNDSAADDVYSSKFFLATNVRKGHYKYLQVTFKNKSGSVDAVFELPKQQVEVFYNALKNLK